MGHSLLILSKSVYAKGRHVLSLAGKILYTAPLFCHARASFNFSVGARCPSLVHGIMQGRPSVDVLHLCDARNITECDTRYHTHDIRYPTEWDRKITPGVIQRAHCETQGLIPFIMTG